MCSRARTPQQDKPPQWEVYAPQLESRPPLSTTRESPPAAMRTQCSQKWIKKYKLKKYYWDTKCIFNWENVENSTLDTSMKIVSSIFSFFFFLYQSVPSSLHLCSVKTVKIIFGQEGESQVIITACTHLFVQTAYSHTPIHIYTEAGRVIQPWWKLQRVINFEKWQ